jgi:gamma-glutamyltranspeptidase/glutathione hydrolase
MCVADRWGNVIAATPSGLGSSAGVAGDTGIIHGARLVSLNTWKGHPNCIAPGKRPRITLTPTLVLKNGKPLVAIAVAGGDLQDQVSAKVSESVREELKRRGHLVTTSSGEIGGAAMLSIDPASHEVRGAGPSAGRVE